MTLVRDLAGVAGAAAVALGAGMVYLPAGVIVGGLLMLAGAILAARRG